VQEVTFYVYSKRQMRGQTTGRKRDKSVRDERGRKIESEQRGEIKKRK